MENKVIATRTWRTAKIDCVQDIESEYTNHTLEVYDNGAVLITSETWELDYYEMEYNLKSRGADIVFGGF